jgi:hypothetical protein
MAGELSNRLFRNHRIFRESSDEGVARIVKPESNSCLPARAIESGSIARLAHGPVELNVVEMGNATVPGDCYSMKGEYEAVWRRAPKARQPVSQCRARPPCQRDDSARTRFRLGPPDYDLAFGNAPIAPSEQKIRKSERTGFRWTQSSI